MARPEKMEKGVFPEGYKNRKRDIKARWPNAWPYDTAENIRRFENEIFTGVKYFNQMLKLKQEKSWLEDEE